MLSLMSQILKFPAILRAEIYNFHTHRRFANKPNVPSAYLFKFSSAKAIKFAVPKRSNLTAKPLLLHHAQERIHVLYPRRVRRVPDRMLFVLDVRYYAAKYHVAAHDRHAHRSTRNVGIGKEIFL